MVRTNGLRRVGVPENTCGTRRVLFCTIRAAAVSDITYRANRSRISCVHVQLVSLVTRPRLADHSFIQLKTARTRESRENVQNTHVAVSLVTCILNRFLFSYLRGGCVKYDAYHRRMSVERFRITMNSNAEELCNTLLSSFSVCMYTDDAQSRQNVRLAAASVR